MHKGLGARPVQQDLDRAPPAPRQPLRALWHSRLLSGLREEMNECLRRYEEVAPLALSAQEDEFLYGR